LTNTCRFGDSKRLLGPFRVAFALLSAVAIAFALLPAGPAGRALAATAIGTLVAGEYGRSVLGGVMGDFLGATICCLELTVYLVLAAEEARFDPRAFARFVLVVSLPQLYGLWRRWYESRAPTAEKTA
jgi:hypothetical protein